MRALVLVAIVCALALSQVATITRMPMRDGVHLSANIFLPSSGGKHPALLVRTPYNKGTKLIANYKIFLDNGFAIVVQDVRGRYDSAGVFTPFTKEDRDGEDTLNWIACQSWSDGSVAMLGGSYFGIAQWRGRSRIILTCARSLRSLPGRMNI